MTRSRAWMPVGAAVAAAVPVMWAARELRRSRTWGATPEEVGMILPGDDLCPRPFRVVTRAVAVDAPPDQVWPWLTQIGQDRSGFFSYTWLENLFGCHMPEIHHLRAEWSTRAVGDRIWMSSPDRADGRLCNVVAEVIPGRALVAVGPDDLERMAAGDQATWVWQWCALPGPVLGTTRLVVRSRYGERVPGLEPVHFVMERKMLRTIDRLAEERWRRTRADPFPRVVPDLTVSPAREEGPAPARR
jgi:hypothetical protein